jgi:16S rRNA (guanine966-N2)-methyltransferase
VRVIAGIAGGQALRAPRTRDTRPITDRVKESLFGILGERVVDARMLDLYAGSGAIGIEALSRGAAHCTFVERGREALEVLRQNLEHTRLADRATVVAGPVERFLAGRPTGTFDLVIVDPPFAEHAILAPLEAMLPVLAPGAIVVVRTFWRTPIPLPAAMGVVRDRRFGETMLTFLEQGAGAGPGVGEGGDR